MLAKVLLVPIVSVLSLLAGSVEASPFLLKAAATGVVPACKQALSEGARLDYADEEGMTALAHAIRHNRLAVVDWILGENHVVKELKRRKSDSLTASETSLDTSENSRLSRRHNRGSSKRVVPPSQTIFRTSSVSSSHESPRAVSELQRQPSRVHFDSILVSTPIILTAESLVSARVAPFGNFLHMAAEFSDMFVLHLVYRALPLSLRTTYINETNSRGRTPLHLAIARGNLQAVDWLVRQGANLNIPFFDTTPLQMAIDLQHREIAILLVSNGVPVGRSRGEEHFLHILRGVSLVYQTHLGIMDFVIRQGVSAHSDTTQQLSLMLLSLARQLSPLQEREPVSIESPSTNNLDEGLSMLYDFSTPQNETIAVADEPVLADGEDKGEDEEKTHKKRKKSTQDKISAQVPVNNLMIM